jgi:hypothetical protein
LFQRPVSSLIFSNAPCSPTIVHGFFATLALDNRNFAAQTGGSGARADHGRRLASHDTTRVHERALTELR